MDGCRQARLPLEITQQADKQCYFAGDAPDLTDESVCNPMPTVRNAMSRCG